VAGGSLTVAAGPRTDLFTDPATGEVTATAPYAAVGAPDGDFTFSARVRPALLDSFDAGCLLVVVDGETWAKLACERSPQGDVMVVSVVTRGQSDDANGMLLDAADVWLRVARIGDAFAFTRPPAARGGSSRGTSRSGRRWRRGWGWPRSRPSATGARRCSATCGSRARRSATCATAASGASRSR
jgi:hypothetical protein